MGGDGSDGQREADLILRGGMYRIKALPVCRSADHRGASSCRFPAAHYALVASGAFYCANSLMEFRVRIPSCLSFLSRFLAAPFCVGRDLDKFFKQE